MPEPGNGRAWPSASPGLGLPDVTKSLYVSADLPPGRAYQLLTTTVVPRPIAWVSSMSADGVVNLAPHSFFTVVSTTPPMVSITSVGAKDTLRNVRETGAFTVSVTTRELTELVNATSGNYPPQAGEYEALGIEAEAGALVPIPAVQASPVRLECRLVETRDYGNCHLIIGEVEAWAIDDEILDSQGLPDPARLDPVGKLGRDDWVHGGQVTSRPRPAF